MASKAVEITSKPSFAKVAASAYVPPKTKETQPRSKSPPQHPSMTHNISASTHTSEPIKDSIPNVVLNQRNKTLLKSNTERSMPPSSTETLPAGVQHAKADTKSTEGSHPALGLLKAMPTDDGSTQLSSDSSAKPPSLDGKSVTSGTTFALDEKESLRPDDSASVKAAEEELFSPPGSIAPGSIISSDNGNRAFRDQLNEIASMGPLPQRGPPVIRIAQSSVQNQGGPILYNPSVGQPQPVAYEPIVMSTPVAETVDPPPDEKLLEALESPRDRLFVLKLEQDYIDFVKNNTESSLDLPQTHAFYRMLAHRLADYYLLGHVLDSSQSAVRIYKTHNCRIPRPLSGMSNPSTSASTPPPNMPAPKILRRRGVDQGDGSNPILKSTDPSRLASEGEGDSGSDQDSKNKTALTREERQAKYDEVKERIFGKPGEGNASVDAAATDDKDMSRSSSASGKKKSRKQRKNSDDGFELRSQYEPYFTTPYTVSNGFGPPDATAYGIYPGYDATSAQSSPPVNVQQFPYNYTYAPIGQPNQAQQFTWQGGVPYGSPNTKQEPQVFGSMQNGSSGYDLGAAFQQMTFQASSANSTQLPSNFAQPYSESFPNGPQPQQIGMWGQMSYPAGVSNNHTHVYPEHQPYNSSNGHQALYPYGQLPNGGSYGGPAQSQHPIPGSFNRQQFNPQSRAFVPHQMAPNAPQYGLTQQMFSPSPGHMGTFAQPAHGSPPYGSPRISHANQAGQRQTIPPFNNLSTPPSQPSNGAPRSSSANHTSQSSTQSTQSTIAKWGAPASLPPKPPPSAVTSQLPKMHDAKSLPPHPFNNGRAVTGSNGLVTNR
ncbi:MAG: hypothetical protein M1820_004814 [Bogoriella megaspora]|nr:MAG: hypothetical protein M1820_004814 [Bogoriella megaspora]